MKTKDELEELASSYDEDREFTCNKAEGPAEVSGIRGVVYEHYDTAVIMEEPICPYYRCDSEQVMTGHGECTNRDSGYRGCPYSDTRGGEFRKDSEGWYW